AGRPTWSPGRSPSSNRRSGRRSRSRCLPSSTSRSRSTVTPTGPTRAGATRPRRARWSDAGPGSIGGAKARRGLDVVVEVELPRVRAQPDRVDLVQALVLDPRLDDV